jgi:hypothetical protein
MGFELNRIMKQYGVNTPGVVNYSGAAAPFTPVEPKAPPVGSDEATSGLYLGAQTKYQADLAAYPELLRKYQLDQKSYDAYKSDYQNRLQNTPMYLQKQFDTGYGTTASTTPTGSDMRTFADRPGNIGVDQANRNIKDWFAQNPNASAADIAAAKNEWKVSDADIRNAMGSGFTYGGTSPSGYGSSGVRYATGAGGIGMDKYNENINKYITDNPYASTSQIQNEANRWGVSNKDLYNATGSYWGNQASNPTYGSTPLSVGNRTPQQKADYYRSQIGLGYTDTDLRNAANSTFGTQTDTDWNYLRNLAYPGSVPAPVTTTGTNGITGVGNLTGNTLGTTGVTGTDGTTDTTQTVNILNNLGDTEVATLRPDGRFYTSGGNKYDRYGVQLYAHGGRVKTHYQTAGRVQLPSGYGSPEEEADFLARQERDRVPVEVNPVDMTSPPPPVMLAPAEAAPVEAPLTTVAMNNAPVPVAPAVAAAPKPPAAVPAFGAERMGNIQALLAAYGPKDGAYGEDLKAARASAKAESDAFAKMLSGAMKSPEDERASKAEMYFRLAAAFGAPTKTGHFAENLGMVGKELGEFSKNKRASAQQKLALALEGQKMKMTAAKEDLNTLRALAGEEMKDKRAIATELIKDYIKSGEPQSTAGKQALDEGLKAGTPEYQKRVQEIGNMNIEGKMAQITASLAGVSATAANLALAQEKFQNQKTQQAKLSGPEIKMKSEAEDLIASSKQSLLDLKQAYALNPNSLAGGWLDKGQQFLSEAAGSKDPVIVNTRILNNLLGSQGLAKLKATFGGSPTEGERAILMELEGIGSKTKEERGAVIKRAYKVLQDRTAREQARLDQINSGAYRMTAPLEEGTE